ncbi:MAG: M14 family metallopeptidase [Planctomycetota bacterium]
MSVKQAVCAAVVLALAGRGGAQPAEFPALQTIAERSEYRKTSTYVECVAQLDAIEQVSKVATRFEMGKTVEGRSIPVIVLADPPVRNAAEAREAARNGKLVVLLFGNIHAGEVDGKEALGALARELASSPGHPLLRNLVIAIAPIYNADGNERFGPTSRNRPGQVGPEDGCGQRHNAMDLDLNRDFIKVEAPETRALLAFMNEWDPALVVDCHTTNGSNHRYLITYAGPKAPAGDPRLPSFAREQFFPSVATEFERLTRRPVFWYGNFEGAFGDAKPGHARWESFPAEARFGTTYIGLRGRMSVLSESYSYATYKDRVLGTNLFCQTVLRAADAQRVEIRRLIDEMDKDARLGAKEVAIRSKVAAWPGKVTVQGFEEEEKDARTRSTDRPKDYQCEFWDRFEPTLTVKAPAAYVILKPSAKVEQTLLAHGIDFARTTAESRVPAEIYRVDSAKSASRLFQGHALVELSATPRPAKATVPAGSIVVRTSQRLSRLVVYLLEPASEDGLATWNFFDEAAKVDSDFPVIRISAVADVPK